VLDVARVHDVKVGFDVARSEWAQTQGIAGNTLYYDVNTVTYDPSTLRNYYWVESTGPIRFRTRSADFGAFVQDVWSVTPDLTARLGARYDHTVQRNDVGDAVVNAGLVSPRAFVAWDPTRDGRTKIAGGWGRYADNGRLAVADFSSRGSYGSKLFLGEFFAESGADGFLNGQGDVYDVVPRTNPNVAHDRIRRPRASEWVLLTERAVRDDVAVAVEGTWRETRNLYEPDETALVYDEDGSAVVGSRQGGGLVSTQRLRTPNAARRRYASVDVSVRKVKSRHWSGEVAYTLTRSFGSSGGATSGSFLVDPQTPFAWGNLGTDRNCALRARALWEVPTPWPAWASASLVMLGGLPVERRYWSEETGGYDLRIRPRDAYTRTPTQWQLDLRLQQEIPVRHGHLTVDVEALNVLDNGAPEDLSALLYSENRLLTVRRQDPLQLLAGIRFGF
jgi:hypothetical protein